MDITRLRELAGMPEDLAGRVLTKLYELTKNPPQNMPAHVNRGWFPTDKFSDIGLPYGNTERSGPLNKQMKTLNKEGLVEISNDITGKKYFKLTDKGMSIGQQMSQSTAQSNDERNSNFKYELFFKNGLRDHFNDSDNRTGLSLYQANKILRSLNFKKGRDYLMLDKERNKQSPLDDDPFDSDISGDEKYDHGYAFDSEEKKNAFVKAIKKK